MASTRTTCPYCGVGCGVIATPRPDGTVGIAGDPDHPANFGRLCSKGSALGETLSLAGRQLYPEIEGRRVEWDEALDHVAAKLSCIIAQNGPDAVAIYASGQLLTEDYYVANKLMKGFIGSGNIDTNSRLCMASSVAGHKRAFGSDTVPGNYEDLEQADLIVLVGSNLAWCHPVLYQRILAARETRPGMRIVTIDPRRTNTSEQSDLHLAIGPDGDAALFAGLLRHLTAVGAVDQAFVAEHTKGFEAALELASDWDHSRVAAATGLSVQDLTTFYDWFTTTERVVTVFSQGVNQSARGTDKVNAIINVHLATGRIGRPGMGPFSVTGQPNAMGGREVGGLANTLAAHMDFTTEAIGRVSRFWETGTVARRPGLRAVDLFRAVADGRVKVVWIMATNPVDSMPEADTVRAALANCPLVIVSDMSAETDTMQYAHVRLPAATWGEKDGTVTNSERRISRQRAFLPLPGESRQDWWIISEVARRMGFNEAFGFQSPADIFAEHAMLSAFENNGARDFDLSGLIGRDYDTIEPVQWPIRPDAGSRERLFGDGRFFTPDARASFVPVTPPEPPSLPAGALTLNTGRVRDHWHTMTRTGKTARLSAHYAEPFVEIHPDDAKRLGIGDADLVRLHNGHGATTVRALLTERQRPGSLFVPMHWTEQFSASGRIDALVMANTDPISAQPALKGGWCFAQPADIARYGFCVSSRKPSFDAAYWALAEAEGGIRAELGWTQAPEDMLQWMRTAFGLSDDTPIQSVQDRWTGRSAFAVVPEGRLEVALFVSPRPVAVSRQWAVGLLQQANLKAPIILAGRPGADMADAGAIVCACFSVGINTIAAAVAEDGCTTVDAVGACTRAGTNCGSCRPEIRRIIDANLRVAAE